ncbi:uncharacterized protein BO87DRAFT_421939 [Aspergillus neoniger CBS 115656]|uniref:Uncharacterized protein n=1 Tax=Aspergillus neoniger (strain CBS 115656) TaxID=1448310 RepID=A0A318Z1M2_ASPNB|nr:hypothetical protein BO87DRAFT_421939 [Aspergillus neoniger CBS 115656]PYH38823.1 hypothetical protein BO87DRAFT_421939 [Aspergillus neoniger CBS 115656]
MSPDSLVLPLQSPISRSTVDKTSGRRRIALVVEFTSASSNEIDSGAAAPPISSRSLIDSYTFPIQSPLGPEVPKCEQLSFLHLHWLETTCSRPLQGWERRAKDAKDNPSVVPHKRLFEPQLLASIHASILPSPI